MRHLSAVTLLSLVLLLSNCGGGGSDSAAPPVNPPPVGTLPTVSIDATPRIVTTNTAATLSWNSTGASSCTASNDWSGAKATSGQEVSAALAISATFTLSCTGTGGTASSSVTVDVTVPSANTQFPLHVDGRHLADVAGKPFLIQGDAAWSLIAQLSREDAQTYLADRKARGFNTLLINLVEYHFANRAPANAYGDEPFVRAGDFSAPNETYFAHADFVLNRARELGFAVLLAPAYLGFDGGSEGWYADLVASSDQTLTNYGRFVATRYGGLGNVIWVYGGDYDPPQKRVVRSIAAGIAAVTPAALGTAHGAPESAPGEFWRGESWLNFDNVYSYDAVDARSQAAYQRSPTKPFILMETAYENEHNTGGKGVRTSAYTALLDGAAGNVFGNNPIWHFNAPNGPDAHGVTWKNALGQPGSVSMTHLWDALGSRRWWTLEPAVSRLLTSGAQPGAVAALAQDRGFAVVYLPSARTIRVDLGLLAGPVVSATWIDPASGASTRDPGSPFETGQAQLTPPQGAGNVDGDWALMLDSLAR